MAAAPKRSMSDIRPVRSTKPTAVHHKKKPQASKPAAEPKPQPVKTPAPVATTAEPALEVERYKELEPPKRARTGWVWLTALVMIAAAAGGTYWVYITYLQ